MSILPQLLVNSLITGSIYALVASGLAMSYGVLRILNFAHGHLMMVGAYAFYLFYSELELGIPLSCIATILCALVLSALSLLIFIKPFASYSYQLPLVTTLALSTILESIVALSFGVNVKSISIGSVDSFQIYDIYITPVQIVIISSACFILFCLGLLVHATPAGRYMRALRENAFAAKSLGISDLRMSLAVFALSTVLAAYAGTLIGIETNLQPTMGGNYTIKAFACMILGGLGSIWGAVLGAYILGLIENLSIGLDFWGWSLPAGYKDAFAFVIILLVLLIRPVGLFGARARQA